MALQATLRVSDSKQAVFVYGTLKHGMVAHDAYLKGCKYIGGCTIPGVLINFGRYPGLIPHEVCRVTGEIYEVSWDQLLNIDHYESNGQLYDRRQIATPLGMAWTYYKRNPPTLTDRTLCVLNGVWLGGVADRCSYAELLDFFTNRRWLEPDKRNLPTLQTLVNQGVPNTAADKPTLILPSPTSARRDENIEKIAKAVAKNLSEPLPQDVVGPGLEMM